MFFFKNLNLFSLSCSLSLLSIFSTSVIASPADVLDKYNLKKQTEPTVQREFKNIKSKTGSPGNLVEYYLEGYENLYNAYSRGSIIYNIGEGSPAGYIMIYTGKPILPKIRGLKIYRKENIWGKAKNQI